MPAVSDQDEGAHKNLLPRDLVHGISRSTRRGFVAAYEDTLFLAIDVQDPESEVARGLDEERMDGSAPLRDSLGFSTVIARADTLGRKRQAGGASQAEIAARLAAHPTYVVPLRKRPGAGKPFADHVSVGRARNNDVVLRHASVSKFHAWFERGDNGAFRLADGRSKNATAVNGAVLPAGQVIDVASGDSLRFGTIDALLLSADVLWQVLAGS
jgi:hypothetical protein